MCLPYAERPFPENVLEAKYQFTEVTRDNGVFAFDWRCPLGRRRLSGPKLVTCRDLLSCVSVLNQ